ncbi:MAG: ExbD/TolR family protein [Gammaproteobacteria bacterium]|jgi:biopolymer transport protein ExbD
MYQRSRRHRHREVAELNITAFMNLMVILVPFLLITAVFSRMAILELNLPGSSSAPGEPPRDLQLEITVRADALEVGDRSAGNLTRFEMKDGDYDYPGLSEYLQQVKARFPEKLDATILLEPEVSYDILVQVMDTVRVADVVQAANVVKAELFPEIAIGDAPL